MTRSSLLVLALLLAGCAGPEATQDVPEVDWSRPIAVETTAVEPWEFRGFLRVAWDGPLMAIDSEVEPDLPRYLVRAGDTVYTSQQAIGWTRIPVEEAVEDGALSNRLVLWDLRLLMAHPELERKVREVGSTTVVDVEGTLAHGGRPLELNATFRIQEGAIVLAHVASPQGRESPFTFTPGPALSFTPKVPAESLTPDAVVEGDQEARDGHVQVIKLLQEYAARRAGQLPERVDADSLRVELALAGQQWPQNPFTDAPLAQGDGSGDIRWKRCTPTTGIYMGLGWDVSVVGETFGGSCTFDA